MLDLSTSSDFFCLFVKVKSKTTASSSSKGKTTTTTRVREKKVFTLPGQKFDPPEEVGNIIAVFCFRYVCGNLVLWLSFFSCFAV